MRNPLAFLFKRLADPVGEGPGAGARAELSRAFADLTAARNGIERTEQRVARLRSIIGAAVTAEITLQDSIAADGGTSLAALAAGDDHPTHTAALLSNAEAASRAALAARAALPAAETELANAKVATAPIEARKQAAIAALMLAHGNMLAEQYAHAFERLCHIHDQLCGFARGAAHTAIGNVVMTSTTIEAPRFKLPALANSGAGPFSPFLAHVPQDSTIAITATAWSRFAARLASDAHAELGDVIATAGTPDQVMDEWARNRHGERLAITRRVRDEPSVRDVLFHDSSKEPRHHRVLA